MGTCIIAWTNGNKTIMASDSASNAGDHITILKQPKFHCFRHLRNPDLIIGYAGRMRSGQVLLDLHLEELPDDEHPDPMTYIYFVVVPHMRMILRESGLTIAEDEEEFTKDSVFLIAYRGKIFEIGPDFCILESADDFIAIGSGTDYALGAMTATKNLAPNISPKETVEQGMLAAAKYSSAVRPPFFFIETSATKENPAPKKKARKKKPKKNKPDSGPKDKGDNDETLPNE